MFARLRLKRPISADVTMDLDDSLATKTALTRLGHLRVPDHGLTPYPDRDMLDGLKAFQRAHGLEDDGVMQPDGPTIKKLNAALAAPPEERSAPVPPAWASMAGTVPVLPTDPPAKSINLPARPKQNPARELKLKRHVSAAANVDLDDALALKTALVELGHLPPPKNGLAPYPDHDLIDSLKAFQRQSGLRVDGEARPDGPTERKVNASLREQAELAATDASTESTATSNSHHDAKPARPDPWSVESILHSAPQPGRDDRNIQVAAAPALLAIPPAGEAVAAALGLTGAGAFAWWHSLTAEQKDQIRGAHDAPPAAEPSDESGPPDAGPWQDVWDDLPEDVRHGLLSVGAYPALAAAFLQHLRDRPRGDDPVNSSTARDVAPRTDVADPLPPVPPSAPLREEEKLPHRTELPPSADAAPSPEGRPITPELWDMIGGYPDQSDDELMQQLILESRGGANAQQDNLDIVDLSHEQSKGRPLRIEHGGGAYTWPDRRYLKETFMHGSPDRRAVRSDVRMHVYDHKGRRALVDFQTYTARADGTPIDYELDSKERIIGWYEDNSELGIPVMIPKSQGKERESWAAKVRKVINVVFDRIENEDYRPIDGWLFWDD